ncbi:MAG: HD domain-containing protein [Bdellovibrionaceae bacterium]|nr:HD domain-containing protein [Pseudobdellovibrionaceae bacterium]
MQELNKANRILVKDLKDRESVNSVFLVKEKNLGIGKTGKSFMSMVLGDNTGNIDGRVWDQVEDLNKEFETGDIVLVKGSVQVFQNRKQLIISKITRQDLSSFQISDFVLSSKKSAEDMFAELMILAKEIQNEHIRLLVLSVLEDPEIKPLLFKAPAAKTIHHAWYGGLLEHILSITKILKDLAKHYDFLNRDLLYFGAIFHDIGKLWELEYDHTFSYTSRGRLIGHMEIACELIDRKATRILGFPSDLKDICKHIILSHHGKLEYGSPKRPKFIEAFLVAFVDDLDSKMSTLNSFLTGERSSGDSWSRYNDLFERYFLLDDLKEKYK